MSWFQIEGLVRKIASLRHSQFEKIGDIQNNHLNVEKLNLGFSKLQSSSSRFWLKHRLGKAIKNLEMLSDWKVRQVDLVWNTHFGTFWGQVTLNPCNSKILVAGCWVSGRSWPVARSAFPSWTTSGREDKLSSPVNLLVRKMDTSFWKQHRKKAVWMHITIYRSCEIPCARLQMSEDDKMSSPPQRIELIFLANDYTGILQTLLRLMKMEEGFVPFQSYIGPVRIKRTKTVAHSPAWLSGLKVLLFSGAAIMWRNMHASLPGTLVLKLRILRGKTSKSRVRSEKSQSWCRICLSTSISCSWILYPVTTFLLAKTKCPNKCLQVLWNKTGPHVALPH